MFESLQHRILWAGGVTGKERSLWLACRPGLIAGGNQIREEAYGADLESHLHDSAGRVTRRRWQKGRTGGKRSKGKRSSNVREEEQLGYSWIRKQSRGQRERGATSGLVAIFTGEDNWDLLQISCCVFLRRVALLPCGADGDKHVCVWWGSRVYVNILKWPPLTPPSPPPPFLLKSQTWQRFKCSCFPNCIAPLR